MDEMTDEMRFTLFGAAIGALINIVRLLAGDYTDLGPPPEFERSVGGAILWVGAWAVRILVSAIVGAILGVLLSRLLGPPIVVFLAICVVLVLIGVPLMAIVWAMDWIIQALRLIRF